MFWIRSLSFAHHTNVLIYFLNVYVISILFLGLQYSIAEFEI